MSRDSRFHRSTNPNTITLGAYPSCKDCLTWSDEGLAVAAGASVHLIRKTDDNSQLLDNGRSVYPTTVLRVDQFTHAEWPEQPLAPIKDLSLGEEQTDAIVVSLAWSPPGLGIHRRSVLAVLTSNLLLSFWETNGSRDGWQRTCIINNHIQEYLQTAHGQLTTQQCRRKTRIRAFTWCKPLYSHDQGRWGLQFLITVDDDQNLTLFSIRKNGRGEHGNWLISVVCTTLVPSMNSPNVAAATTKLQRRLLRSLQVDCVTMSDWQAEESAAPTNVPTVMAQAVINCEWIHRPAPTTVQAKISISGEVIAGQLHVISTTPAISTLHGSSSMSDIAAKATRVEVCNIVHSVKTRPQWREALEPICAEYREKNQLGDWYRIRYWGFATSPMKTFEAACVTFHPRDMFEYTSAAHEKSYILFRALRGQIIENVPGVKTDKDVFRLVVAADIRLIESGVMPKTALDHRLQKILRTRANLAATYEKEIAFLDSLWAKLSSDGDLLATLSGQGEKAANASMMPRSITTPEICDVCNANIPVHVATQEAVCSSGHSFTRCNISGIAIQEPGISKFCSSCNRPFLNLSKFESHNHNSLLSMLFEEFDVCPYCGGKYRG